MTLGQPATEKFLASLPTSFGGSSPLPQAAASNAPVLILGEPGTGRSVVARLLHRLGPRSAAPLVELDPAAVPASLLESELFGYRAGAFTGAERSQTGRVARAEGGTLVLDHVEELPMTSQPKLLRLLAEHRYAPLGGTEIQAEVRFLAIGAHDLPERVDRGVFRADLFYRLEVLTFVLPPLRERLQDLDALLASLLGDLGERFSRPGLELSARSRAWMPAYTWPGNLRQLKNLLERAMLYAENNVLDPPPPPELATSVAGVPATLAEAERVAIVAALAATRGHQGHAAALLGISRKGLWEKRKRLAIP
ncbi:MAG: sigma 54-interacting transcriptional regulator [Thermoanaerobaculia bacterium]